MQALQVVDSLLTQIDTLTSTESLRITSIELFRTTLAFVETYDTALGVLVDQTNVVCKVNTNVDGLFGFGEACPLVKFTEETTDSIWDVTKRKIYPCIRDRNPLDVARIGQLLDATVDDHNIMAKGMIDMALWDIYGKFYGKPVYRCLSDVVANERIPLLYPFGDQTIEKDTQMLTEKMKQGYKTFMLKMGANQDIAYEVARVQNVEKKFGPIGEKLFIVPDANQGYNFEQAQQLIAGCKNIKLSCMEQPIGKNEWDKLKILQQQCTENGFDLSLDESVQNMEAIRYALQHRIGSVFSVKVSKNGGISKLYDMTKLCNENGIKCLFNSMLEYGIAQAALLSVIAVTANIVPMGHCFMSTLRFQDDITDFRTLISKDKIVRLSEKPGLGISVDESKLASYSSKIEKISQ